MPRMLKRMGIALLASLLVGCGSQKLSYTPVESRFVDRAHAVEVIEQAFFEDYSKGARPQSVLVTDKVIILSDGVISQGSSVGSAVAVGAGAFAVGNTTVVTRDAGRRIYLNSIGDISLYQKRGRDNRFVVIIRALDGSQMVSVRTRSLDRAKQFSDAIAFIKAPSR
ncbi:hypothetical protein [Pseudomonas fontis]|uniref:Lipoprotein n=1 Tax=Pseudomonas fontis TaxID=2942633 RepID=A0ABT5NXS1_9PSED|nr:hypothetical protein [Pseudomonas fontis]MDD0972470.1 hypothetical protein [Pseudomonas fontis]MDD0992994.1 hypothetical protein [Pseudomonas fontis]